MADFKFLKRQFLLLFFFLFLPIYPFPHAFDCKLCLLQLEGRVNPLCVVADDSIFLTLLAANLSKNSHVISMFPGLRDKGAQYLENVAKANGFSIDRVEVPEKRKTCLTMHDTLGKKVILVQLLLYLTF